MVESSEERGQGTGSLLPEVNSEAARKGFNSTRTHETGEGFDGGCGCSCACENEVIARLSRRRRVEDEESKTK
ncbi:unnamed protein product [Linum trigynum]|uniref:Uncharacterized protein n=1 Tax=Linum trigynum TaxID=586398 RepID=A0AAV2DUH1_9ROSI